MPLLTVTTLIHTPHDFNETVFLRSFFMAHEPSHAVSHDECQLMMSPVCVALSTVDLFRWCTQCRSWFIAQGRIYLVMCYLSCHYVAIKVFRNMSHCFFFLLRLLFTSSMWLKIVAVTYLKKMLFTGFLLLRKLHLYIKNNMISNQTHTSSLTPLFFFTSFLTLSPPFVLFWQHFDSWAWSQSVTGSFFTLWISDLKCLPLTLEPSAH